MRKNLVVVRAGDDSAHPAWLEGSRRNWDLAVSYYGRDPDRLGDGFVFKHVMPGSKFAALSAMLQAHRACIDAYDRIVLADDDVVMDADTISRFFDVSEEFGLELSQPALHEDSFHSHPVTLRNPLFRLRFTTFVEIMFPCFTRAFLRRIEDSFGENLSGWGLDYLWPRSVSGREKIAIVDETPMLHPRPVGGPMHGFFKAQGIDPRAEMEAVFGKYGFAPRRAVALGGIGTDGLPYWVDQPSHGAFVIRLLSGYFGLKLRQPANFVFLVEDSLRSLRPREEAPAAPAPAAVEAGPDDAAQDRPAQA